ncbi:MAG TPA: hypothetical protein DEP45_15590 [Armatimonadetes bacterium]|nr:hypothetical protein [Armatimonadota bacterium]
MGTHRYIREILITCLILLAAPAWAQQNRSSDPIARWLNDHSDEVVQGTLGAMMIVGDYRTEDAAALTLDGTVAAAAAAEALKLVIDQPRPRDPSAHDGFPSSHAAGAFAFAHGISQWRPSWTPAVYAFAAGVGWARVEGGYHTLEQVAAGAALGVWIAGISHSQDGFLIHGGSEHSARSFSGQSGTPSAGGFGAPATVVLWTGEW